MKTVTSNDGALIAFNQIGTGTTVILVSGALQYRAVDQGMGQLADLLAKHFTVISYDRRGRGKSGDTPPFTIEREIEDIEALIDATGGSSFLYGISSGAALAMEATIKLGNKVNKLALYEAPYNDDETARQRWIKYRQQLTQLLSENRKGDALISFMMLVGMEDEHIPMVRQAPEWELFEAIAPTLAYDAAVLGEDAAVPVDRARKISVPTLIMDGGASYPFMYETAIALTQAIPNSKHLTLEGQTHEVDSEALAPILLEFFSTNATISV